MLFRIAANHPSLAGHFPGNPVVPGVVLLDHILATAKSALPTQRVCGMRKIKFLQPVLPEQVCEVQWSAVRASVAEAAQVRFACVCEGQRVAEGNLLLETA
jgi:3-hydroxymyristoyl/3-hydroxydecanoyl-(acyl carrier protein) dehydratase